MFLSPKLRIRTCLALLVLTFLGCGLAGNRFTAEETESQDFKVKGSARLYVDTFNGGIDVSTGAHGIVHASVIKSTGGATQEEADQDLENIDVVMAQDGDKIRIEVKQVDKKVMSNRGARVELKVPAGSILDLRTHNGKVSAAGDLGDVSAHSSNGALTIKGSKGKLDLDTSNGAITAEGGRGPLMVKTSNGSITLQADEAVVTAHSSNGAIRFSGSLASGKHELTTSNGAIVVTLPADAEFVVDAETHNGKISSDFDPKTSKSRKKSRLTSTVGDNPDVVLKLRSSNSNIQILRASR